MITHFSGSVLTLQLGLKLPFCPFTICLQTSLHQLVCQFLICFSVHSSDDQTCFFFFISYCYYFLTYSKYPPWFSADVLTLQLPVGISVAKAPLAWEILSVRAFSLKFVGIKILFFISLSSPHFITPQDRLLSFLSLGLSEVSASKEGFSSPWNRFFECHMLISLKN